MKGDPTSSGQWSTNGDLQVVLNWSKSGLKVGSKWHKISLKIVLKIGPKCSENGQNGIKTVHNCILMSPNIDDKKCSTQNFQNVLQILPHLSLDLP